MIDITSEFNEHLAIEGLSVIAPDDNARLLELVKQGWRVCYVEWFGRDFVKALAAHHIEAVEWHWDSRIAVLEKRKPEYFAYFPIWSRGHMKSSLAERMVVVDGMVSWAYGRPGYALYVARSKSKVEEHIKNIETLLSDELIRKWCPALSNPKRSVTTDRNSKWTSTFLKSEANYSIQGGSLDSGLAGSRVEETRPSIIFLDDIDGREHSPVISDSRLKMLTSEVLPMGQSGTLTFFAQNFIDRFSCMYRIHSNQVHVLTNRKPSAPIPAVINLVTREETVNGIVRDLYVSGESTWQSWDIDRIQEEIDREGLPSFLTECQHNVAEVRKGRILSNYDDDIHVISESEFENTWGKDEWLTWRKKPGNDWARTKTDYHANVACWLTISDVRSKLPNVKVLRHALSFPEDSAAEDIAERLLSCLNPYAYIDKNGGVTWEQLRKDVLANVNADQHTSTIRDKMNYERGSLSRIIPQYSAPLLQRCNVQQGEMSHEMDTVRKIYRTVYALPFKGVNPHKYGGVEGIQRDMRVDRDRPHAIRPGVMGYTKWYLVAPDDKTRPYIKDGVKLYYPRPFPTELKTAKLEDTDLWRFQLKNYSNRPPILTAAGEEIDNPEKMYDDGPNALMMMEVGSPLQGTSLTPDQQVEMLIPQEVKDALKSTEPEGRVQNMLAYQWQKSIASGVIFKPQEENYDEYE